MNNATRLVSISAMSLECILYHKLCVLLLLLLQLLVYLAPGPHLHLYMGHE